MAVSEAHKRASNKWNSSRDNIMIRPDKETGAAIRAAATAADMSVQAYVLRAVCAWMEREEARIAHDDPPAGGACTEDKQRGGGGDNEAGVISIISDGEAAPMPSVGISPMRKNSSSSTE